jgi:nucleoside-diphosphate-sugar epimerase
LHFSRIRSLEMPSSQVLLTGGNGFIAVHILELLLQHGHIVTTTVRSESKTTYLRQKFSEAVASGQLKFAIVKDITSAGAFNEVVKSNSFDTVLHTSSPFVFDVYVLSLLVFNTNSFFPVVKTQ